MSTYETLSLNPEPPVPVKEEEAKPLIAQRARPRHSPPSMVENRLACRQRAYDYAVREHHLDTRAYHKPGSLNRHKC